MCEDKEKTLATVKEILIRMKGCLLEAKKPLTEIAASTLRHILLKRKGNQYGKENQAQTHS